MTGHRVSLVDPAGLADQLGTALTEAGLRWRVLDASAVGDIEDEAAVITLDHWTPAQVTELSRHVWRSSALLLPVRADGTTALIGPLLHAGAPACLGCTEVERLATIGGRTPRDQ
ncbi:MAG TPA: hypothetical protein VFX61_02480, partial [Micromonosporaceae bacterium]|nr:hypothetical protein [Micromonosporaceae bacterium]